MEFKEYIAFNREAIHSKILDYLPIREPVEYSTMVRDYSDRQGKYVRPGLLMLCGEMFGAKSQDLILPAAIMQLSEDWILMHDDVEDDSELRRGKPALHRIYGMEQAVNAGDAAHLAMWRMMGDYVKGRGLSRGMELYERFHRMLDKTVEGQYLDIKFTKDIRQIGRADEKMYFDIVERKTSSYSVYGPMQLGATVAGQGKKTLDALREIGSAAGTAFQIMDDVLDVTSSEKEFGKQKYGDLYEGKLTLVMLHAYKEASRAEKAKIDRIFKKDRNKKSKEEIDFLVYMIEKYGSADNACREAMKYGKKAQAAIKKYDGLFPDGDYKDLFVSAVTALFLRKK